ncbi:ribosome silencing factor [Hydrogenovibrio marinus]|uniref:Ribosomal silencing factor RsfS n=1 Tax=Hydrogenovibrio marinus TaxID=28885 RepID=A0A067A1J0_HYDMR|nr:ribosome silencing factor [Hydrogenovibrio marinus]KDN96491.1 ribosome-associated protein IOJAP [Hydrogenovibrio marinus]BBN60310.1 ribosomal silencing factor RsfS [Hydrogenovibrio marinus]
MDIKDVEDLVVKTLEDSKARDIQVLDVTELCSFTDRMIVATGTSSTHVRSTGDAVAQAFKDINEAPLGVEAGPEPDWVLVDLGNAVVHVMTESARAHYQLEKLWQAPSAQEMVNSAKA